MMTVDVADIFLPNSIIQPPCVRTVRTHRGFVRTKAARKGRLRPWKACAERSCAAQGFPLKEKGVLESRNRMVLKRYVVLLRKCARFRKGEFAVRSWGSAGERRVKSPFQTG